MTTEYASIVVEREDNGSFSATVPGYPIFVAADTEAEAAGLARDGLALLLRESATASRAARVHFARIQRPLEGPATVSFVGVGAVLGSAKSAAKTRSSRANGKLGGRPRIALSRRSR